MDSLFDAVRAACSPGVWSRGVELVRANCVTRESAGDDEIVMRVVARGRPISPRVTLFLDDDDWDCDCPSKLPACEHVAAAVIALRQAARGERELRQGALGPVQLGYRLRRAPGGLAFLRVVGRAADAPPLRGTIASATTGRRDGPEIAATQADLAVELALGTFRDGTVPRPIAARLLAALERCSDVTLDGEPVRASRRPVLPIARLEDQGEGFRLRVEDDPDVREVFDNGIVLCGDTLRPVGEQRLTGRELHELPEGRYYPPEQVAELVTAVLPSLRERVEVDIRTRRLPETASEPPRIAFDLTRHGETLSVLPTLVYGDPPTARIDAGRLEHLRGAVPVRDERAEQALLRRLGRELDLAPGLRARFEGEQAVAFAKRLRRWSGDVDRRALAAFREAPPLVARLDASGGGFPVSFETAGEMVGTARGGGAADPAAVVRAWREGRSLVPLAGGGWSRIPAEWLDRHGHRVADLLAARDEAGRLPGCALPDLAALCEELGDPPPPGFDRLRALATDFAGLPEVPLPADLRATLRQYQRRGVDWLAFLREAGLGAMLADDMGLGKTLQALCAIRGRTLVVAPTSVLTNWSEEIERFRPKLTTCVYHGPRRELDPDADVTLTTYALLRLDAEPLAAVRWDTVVLDEAQAIKNPDSQVARAAYRLDAGFRVTLTGTPVENRLDELWSQFHFANRGLLGGREDFDARYARPIADGEAGAAPRLRERIRPFVLRRLKREVAPELPPRTEVVLHCELDADQRQVYDTVRAATLAQVVERLRQGGSVLQALEALLRLRQAACHAALVPGQQAASSAKLELLRETLETIAAEGHKALVFSQWTALLDLIEPQLEAAGIGFVRLDGSTRDRAGVVRAFQDETGPPAMLISLKAGGTGLNLTAADHVFIVDPWWNPAVEDQAADRAHRIGQDKPVMVYRLVAEQTVEERILLLQKKKREIADAALGDADRAVSLSREDLLALLD